MDLNYNGVGIFNGHCLLQIREPTSHGHNSEADSGVVRDRHFFRTSASHEGCASPKKLTSGGGGGGGGGGLRHFFRSAIWQMNYFGINGFSV